MRIELYTICWNDRRMLPFFLDYHAAWVDRMVVFDDGSDDGSRDLLAAHPKVEMRDLPPKGDSFVYTALSIWEHAWKESRGRADWVVLANIDEFIWHRDGMRSYLERCTREGATMIHPRGYEMVGEAFPPAGTSIVDAIRTGVAMAGQDKRQVFVPDRIGNIGYSPGRHHCLPDGPVVEPPVVEARLFHYKYVDFDGYLLPRQQALAARLPPYDVAHNFGLQYTLEPYKKRYAYDWLTLHATDVVV